MLRPRKGGNPRGVITVSCFQVQYNSSTADRIVCSCVTCPKCGTWVVVKEVSERRTVKDRFIANCPAPDCFKAFEFELRETRIFEVPLPLFERRHFYRSEIS